MDSRTRLLTAWAFEEPDRVPIELQIAPVAKTFPEAKKIVEFIDNEADNFWGVPAASWQFCGLGAEYREEVVREDERYRRLKRTFSTEAGEFVAYTRHNVDELNVTDFHWEQRYIHTIDDMKRLAEAPRKEVPLDPEGFKRGAERIGARGVPLVGVLHPLGWLVRNANMEEVYIWFHSEKETIHRFLESSTRQLVETVERMGHEGIGPYFSVTAHEMLIPPWMGPDQFDELVVPYDSRIYDAVHRIGGRVRAHCHGNCGAYLETMSRMGIDAIEPLEEPPFGDVDLARAKRQVGDRMLLSGNIPSNLYLQMSPDDVRRAVRDAIRAAGKGGGYTLRHTGGHASTNSAKNDEQMRKFLANVEAYIEAGLEYG
jgi:hypothetical protein